MTEKNESVTAVSVLDTETSIETTSKGIDDQKNVNWGRRIKRTAAALTVLSVLGYGVNEFRKWVEREREQDKIALAYLEDTDARFIGEEFREERSLRVIGDIAILHGGVEVRDNCSTKDSTMLLKPSDNVFTVVPDGKMLVVTLPTRRVDNDGSYWLRFSMMNQIAPLLDNASPSSAPTAFSANDVASRNVCVDASKYAGQTTANGEPMVDYYSSSGSAANKNLINGTMDNSGIIRTPEGTVASVGHFLDDGVAGKLFLDNLLSAAQELPNRPRG